MARRTKNAEMPSERPRQPLDIQELHDLENLGFSEEELLEMHPDEARLFLSGELEVPSRPEPPAS